MTALNKQLEEQLAWLSTFNFYSSKFNSENALALKFELEAWKATIEKLTEDEIKKGRIECKLKYSNAPTMMQFIYTAKNIDETDKAFIKAINKDYTLPIFYTIAAKNKILSGFYNMDYTQYNTFNLFKNAYEQVCNEIINNKDFDATEFEIYNLNYNNEFKENPVCSILEEARRENQYLNKSYFYLDLPKKQPLPFDKRLLIVEDDNFQAEALAQIFNFYTSPITIVHSSLTAVFYVKQYDVVILDISLPDYDGFTIAPYLRKKNPNLIIAMMTASELTPKLHAKANKVKADFLISKSDFLNNIEAKAHEILSKNKQV